MNFHHRRALPWLSLILPPLLWAGNFVVGRAVRQDITPMTLSFGRWAIALLCLLPFALGAMRRDWREYWTYRWHVIGVSIVGVAAFNSLVYAGLRTTTASNALLLNSLIPVFIIVLDGVFNRQRLSALQGVGLVLSFAGVLMLVLHGKLDWHAMTFVPGDAIVLSAMLCWAVYTLWLRRFPPTLDRIGLMGVQVVIALFVLLPFLMWEHASGLRSQWGPVAFGALTYVGIFPSVLAYLFYMHAVRSFGAARAGLSIHLLPVFGVVLSVLFLHEQLHGYHAVGISAIVAGLVLSNLRASA